ncbi:hypothetical protein D3C71_2179380 [compost metagenome]
MLDVLVKILEGRAARMSSGGIVQDHLAGVMPDAVVVELDGDGLAAHRLPRGVGNGVFNIAVEIVQPA